MANKERSKTTFAADVMIGDTPLRDLLGQGGYNFPDNQSQNKVNLVAIGDSRTYLNHAGFAWPNPYRFDNGIVNQALSMMNERYRWETAYDSGVSGDTAQGVDTRKTAIATIMSKRPANEEWDLVYWVDINDAIGGVSITSFVNSFKSAMKYFLGLGIGNVYVLSGIPYPNGYGGESDSLHKTRIALIKGYNAGMKAYCATTPRLHFIDSYSDYGNGADVPIPEDGNTSIHPGSIGATRIAKNLVISMTAARGKFTEPPGIPVSPNPRLINCENFTGASQVTDNFYCSSFSGAILTRDPVDGALTIDLDARDGVGKVFNIFNNGGSFTDTIMPGDVMQGCLDLEYLEVYGLPGGISLKIQGVLVGNQAWANSPTGGYTKGVLTGIGRQVYMTDPFLIPNARVGERMQPYLNCGINAGNRLKVKVREASCRRVYTSPNAEYSAAITLPLHRRNIKCLTATAAAGFTITLPPLYNVEDGAVWRFQDTEGSASTKNITIAGNSTEVIKDGATSANTAVLNTDYFNKAYRADRGANAWVAIN